MYSVRTPAPGTVVEDRIVIPQAPEPSSDSAVYAHLLVGGGTLKGSAFGVSAASLSDGEVGNEADQPTVSDAVLNEPAKISAGTVALFYRASLVSDTQNLTTVVPDARGESNHGISGKSWESGSKGIVRYILVTGQTDVIKTIVSTSYSKRAIYPVTVGDRL